MTRNLQRLEILHLYLSQAYQILEGIESSWEESIVLSEPDQIIESISEILDLLDALLDMIEREIESSKRNES